MEEPRYPGQRPRAPRPKLVAAVKGRLVHDWHDWHKWWSVRLIALDAVLQAIPAEQFLSIYSYLPEDVQGLMPGRTSILVGLAVLAGLARIIDQKGRKDGD